MVLNLRRLCAYLIWMPTVYSLKCLRLKSMTTSISSAFTYSAPCNFISSELHRASTARCLKTSAQALQIHLWPDVTMPRGRGVQMSSCFFWKQVGFPL